MRQIKQSELDTFTGLENVRPDDTVIFVLEDEELKRLFLYTHNLCTEYDKRHHAARHAEIDHDAAVGTDEKHDSNNCTFCKECVALNQLFDQNRKLGEIFWIALQEELDSKKLKDVSAVDGRCLLSMRNGWKVVAAPIPQLPQPRIQVIGPGGVMSEEDLFAKIAGLRR